MISKELVNKKWSRYKFIGGKCVGSANSPDWQGFFVHIIMLGLSNNEKYMLKKED